MEEEDSLEDLLAKLEAAPAQRPLTTEWAEWAGVGSSWVRRVGWDGRLLVEFLDGAVCAFAVPRELFKEMLQSPSKGAFVHRHLKGLPYEKL